MSRIIKDSMFSGANNLSQFNRRNVIIWMTLAFQAGAVNSGGFLACHRFVTHTTGFATHFGAEVAQGHYVAALSMATVPLFFLMGAMFSAYFVDHKVATGKLPRYDFLLGAIAALMMVIAVGGDFGIFGVFGDSYSSFADFAVLALLSTAMGIQNASITSASGSVIRTTHLTGVTTDLGIGLVRIISPGVPELVREQERRASLMRIGLIGFFILGSTISAFAFMEIDYSGFFIPAVTSLGVLFFAHYSAIRNRQLSLFASGVKK